MVTYMKIVNWKKTFQCHTGLLVTTLEDCSIFLVRWWFWAVVPCMDHCIIVYFKLYINKQSILYLKNVKKNNFYCMQSPCIHSVAMEPMNLTMMYQKQLWTVVQDDQYLSGRNIQPVIIIINNSFFFFFLINPVS